MDDEEYICRLFNLKGLFKYLKSTNDCHLKKDKSLSEDVRKAGNELYTRKNHDQDIHNQVLMHYTKSIAFAPKDSEELALGFSNRSALLMHLHRYEECLIDIDRALEITESDQLKSKLQTRKKSCFSLISDMKGTKNKKMKNNTQSKLPHIVRSAKIPCAAEFVSIESNKMYKRQLTATRNIKPGEIVIIEKAYVCCPKRNQIYLSCSHCLSFAWSGLPCEFCVYSIYCSETCKQKAWEEYHDVECSLLPYFYILKNCEPINRVLLAKIFIKAVKAEGFENIINQTELIDNGILDLFRDGTFNSNIFGYTYSLHCRPQNKKLEFNDCIGEVSIIYLLVKLTNLIPITKKSKKLNSTDKRFLIQLKDIFIKLKSIVDLNAFSHQWYKCTHQDFLDCKDKCNSQRGAIIAPCTAIINHSCIPNLNRFALPGPKMIVYASRPIKKGEQLYLSYGPSYSTDLAERKLWLEKKMNYTCKCMACIDDQFYKQNVDKKNTPNKMSKVYSEFKNIFGHHAMEFFFTGNVSDWRVFNKASLKQAFKLNELYHKHFECNEACLYSGSLNYFIRRAFHELYGEKCATSNCC